MRLFTFLWRNANRSFHSCRERLAQAYHTKCCDFDMKGAVALRESNDGVKLVSPLITEGSLLTLDMIS